MTNAKKFRGGEEFMQANIYCAGVCLGIMLNTYVFVREKGFHIVCKATAINTGTLLAMVLGWVS